MKIIKKYYDFMNDLKNEPFVSLVGGSRSGKTYNVLQYLLMFERKNISFDSIST